MDFKEAQGVIMPFGRFKGKTIDEIAMTDDGLRYLDWLYGQKIESPVLWDAINTYMRDPVISRELDELLHS
jgi:hypothetical protein